MSEPKIVCAFELPAPIRARLLRLGAEELTRECDGRKMTSTRFGLCPICLSPTWKSSMSNEDTELTVHASVDRNELCAPCEDARYKFPDVFRWIVYVLGSRGIIGGEPPQ